jgi:hypothetical protein
MSTYELIVQDIVYTYGPIIGDGYEYNVRVTQTQYDEIQDEAANSRGCCGVVVTPDANAIRIGLRVVEPYVGVMNFFPTAPSDQWIITKI